eukprot:155528-Prymnesium_polylepis.1
MNRVSFAVVGTAPFGQMKEEEAMGMCAGVAPPPGAGTNHPVESEFDSCCVLLRGALVPRPPAKLIGVCVMLGHVALLCVRFASGLRVRCRAACRVRGLGLLGTHP